MENLSGTALYSLYKCSSFSILEMKAMADFIIGGIATALILDYLIYALFRAEDL